MKKVHLAIICLFASCSIYAQNIDIQPVPQQVSNKEKQISLTETYQLSGDTDANPYAVQELKKLLAGKQPGNTGVHIYIGEKGDKAIRKFNRLIPAHKEGYYLSINDKEIVLAGNDERGTYYALQTLRQLLNNNELPVIENKGLSVHPLPWCSRRFLRHSLEPCRPSSPTPVLWRK